MSADGGAIVAAVVLVVGCAVVGQLLLVRGVHLQLPLPPVLARWGPHLGPGSAPALLVAAAAVALARVVDRWPWRRLVLTGWALGLGWIVSLALLDGDWSHILESQHEYLQALGRIDGPLEFLASFTDHIVRGDGAWTTHVAGHPPLATLVFWWLAAAGLGGGWWAGLMCMVVGSLAGPALVITVAELGAAGAARRLVPLAAVFPGAVWIGVSADGLFAGVALSGLALVTAGAVRGWPVLSLFGGLLLGCTLYLSYGHLLFGLAVLVVAACTRGGAKHSWWRCWVAATTGVLLVASCFTATGFWWPEGMELLRIRYHQGIASTRPQGYFVLANLAAAIVAASPLLAVAARRAAGTIVRVVHRGPSSLRDTERMVPVLIAAAGLAMILLADLTGLSKGETERIWLTFLMLVWAGLALTPRAQLPLAPRAQLPSNVVIAAGWTLLINHLLVTNW